MPRPNLREKLLSAGLATLHARGFNATSVQEITDAAGAPKGSFYNHFASKDDLGAAAVEEYAARSAARLRVFEDAALPPLARLRRHFESLIEAGRFPDTPGCLLGNFAAELSLQSPAIRARVAAALASWSEAVARLLDEARRAGALPPDSDPAALAAFVVDAWEGALLRAKVAGTRAPLDAFLEIIFAKVLA